MQSSLVARRHRRSRMSQGRFSGTAPGQASPANYYSLDRFKSDRNDPSRLRASATASISLRARMITRRLRSPGSRVYLRRAVDHCESSARTRVGLIRIAPGFWRADADHCETHAGKHDDHRSRGLFAPSAATVQCMRVDHRRAHGSVTERSSVPYGAGARSDAPRGDSARG